MTKERQDGQHLPLLTSFRFFAALLVVICHNAVVWEKATSPLLIDLKSNGGRYGVTFFFVLSGFILAHRYQSSDLNLKRYFRSRFARIVPLYWLCLILSVGSFLVTCRLTYEAFPLLPVVKDFAVKFFFLQSVYSPWNADFPILQQGWTLSVEILFYACFPYFLRLALSWTSSQRLWVVGVSIAFHLVATYLQWHVTAFESIGFHFLAWFPLVHFPLFLLGMSLKLDHDVWLRVAKGASSMFLPGLFFAFWFWRGLDMHQPLPVLGLIWITAHLVTVGSIKTSGLLSHPLFLYLGNASYGLYLLHGLAAAVTPFLLKKIGLEPSLDAYPYFIGSTVVGIATSCVLYSAFEQPMRRWINRSQSSN